MEPEKMREIVSENRSLEEQLTKRNQQYIFDLKKSLAAANLSEEEQALALHDILPTLVTEQKTGKTARQLFGTVSERTESIINKPEAPVEADKRPVLMWLDNFMLLFGIFAIMTSLLQLFAQNSSSTQAVGYGLIGLLAASAVGGWVFYLMYKYIYQYEQPGADRSKKPKMWKTAVVLVLATLFWMAAFSLASILPATINLQLDPIIMVVLGLLVLVGRHFLKKKFNIVGSLSVPRQPKR